MNARPTSLKLLGVALALATLPSLALAQDKGEYRVGGTFSTTGPASLVGDPEAKAVQMCVNQINREGGIKGRKINLTWYDDGGDVRKAMANVRRLVEDDKVHLLVGPSTTGATMAVIPQVEQAQIPLISVAGGTVITTPPKKWIFASSYTDRLVIEGVYSELKARGLTRVGLLSGSGGFDQSCRGSAKALAPAAGLTIVADELHGEGDTDMTAQFANLRKADAQVVLYCGFGASTSIVARNHKRLEVRQPLYMTTGAALKQFIRGAEGAAQGVRVGAFAVLVPEQLPAGHPQKQISEDFVKQYTTTYNDEVSIFASAGYDACLIMRDAMMRADSPDPAKLRDAIETTKELKATAGVVNMSPSDHLGLNSSDILILEVDGANWKLVR